LAECACQKYSRILCKPILRARTRVIQSRKQVRTRPRQKYIDPCNIGERGNKRARITLLQRGLSRSAATSSEHSRNTFGLLRFQDASRE
jgi:hypothetical protein